MLWEKKIPRLTGISALPLPVLLQLLVGELDLHGGLGSERRHVDALEGTSDRGTIRRPSHSVDLSEQIGRCHHVVQVQILKQRVKENFFG